MSNQILLVHPFLNLGVDDHIAGVTPALDTETILEPLQVQRMRIGTSPSPLLLATSLFDSLLHVALVVGESLEESGAVLGEAVLVDSVSLSAGPVLYENVDDVVSSVELRIGLKSTMLASF